MFPIFIEVTPLPVTTHEPPTCRVNMSSVIRVQRFTPDNPKSSPYTKLSISDGGSIFVAESPELIDAAMRDFMTALVREPS